MVWKGLLVAVLLTPPVAYVADVLVATDEPVDRRPALVLESEGSEPADIAPRVTLGPSPKTGEGADPDGDPDEADDLDDADDVRVVRPGAQDLDDQADEDEAEADDEADDIDDEVDG